ncbi:Hypothetical predicted protein [Cloeon dipterum]|uniref:Anaphase-promoting complex subunit 4 WD40 domain-containing protein n=1 Tax=Cloeon dipterum TaxID=197152 RepID=A0A8S1C507_9INSE|nr:Hypothetical predicted protein [Cloeon dipterum]
MADADDDFSLDPNDVYEEVEIEDLENMLESDGSENGDDDGAAGEEEEDLAPYVPERDDAKLVFNKHTKSVFCCDIDKTGTLAVTGGEDDIAYVWELSTGEVKITCKDNSDSVVSAKFNHDGSLVATGDMAGNVQVWKISNQERVLQDQISELNWMEWHPAINVLFAGAADGNVTFWRVSSGECKILPSNGVSSEVGKILPDGKRAVVGYEDGSVRVFDLHTCKCTFQVPADGVPIKSMSCHRDNTMVMAGCNNGETKLVNTKNGKVLGKLSCAAPEPYCVESAEFCPWENHANLAACVTLNGDISVWEISRQEIRNKTSLPENMTKLAWSKTNRCLILGTVKGDVELMNGLDLSKKIPPLLGHSSTILDFCQSGDGKLLLTVSDDFTARVFEMPVIE